MKKITLDGLLIQNFKGVENLEVRFGDNTSINGENASGKTTVLDAVMWLLFGKDSTGRSDFQIRPVDTSGNTVDYVDIMVAAHMTVDGVGVSLYKTQKQNWVKKRGSDAPTFQGNVNSYEINGFPASQKEFDAQIADIVDENLFRLLTDPRAFARLPWKDQREMLLRFVSDITDADILKTGNYELITADVLAAGADKSREKAMKTLKLLKDKQKEYPARIDELVKTIDSTKNEAELKERLGTLKESLAELREVKEDLDASLKAIEDINSKVLNVRLKKKELENEERQKLIDAKHKAESESSNVKYKIAGLENSITQAETAIRIAEMDIKNKEAFIKECSDDYRKVRARALPEDETKCPTCGRPYEEDKTEEIRKEFEARKTRDLARIEKTGKEMRASIIDQQSNISANQKKLEDAKKEIEILKANLDGMAKIADIPAEVDMSKVAGYNLLAEQERSLVEQLALMDKHEDRKQAFTDKETALLTEIRATENGLAVIDANKRIMERIDVLKAEQMDCTQKVADQEEILYLLEKFTKAKMDMLSDRINSKFKSVRWKLFQNQINGGVKECCVMQIASNGSYVDYPNANNAAQIIGGLDVINALSELYEISTPVWIDNAEAINGYNIPEMKSQMILLRVTDDKKLTIK